ncbi:uncharacterized protein LOC126834560 [Adelges cooleyi]|uniref:uncharacterized protein LOC126834560 n=1 Tax=Adelges cooleyi TaxID=133065 RepID=UPI00217FCD91|nr:uncharacterized protein LOC126834560 [Adelges cooleyi]
MFFIKMEVKYIISMCLIFSIAAVKLLDDEEIKDLWDNLREKYNGLTFEQFELIAKNGLVPSLKSDEIDNLWKSIKSEDREYITFRDIGQYYENDDIKELLEVLQEIVPERITDPTSGRTEHTFDKGTFTKAVNLGLIPRCPGMHEIFKKIIQDDVRDYINMNDLKAYYTKYTEFHLIPIMNQYGEPKGNGQKLYFGAFSRAVNLAYFPSPKAPISE